MIATPDIEQIIGAEAVDPNNDKIGKVSQVYVDADTDQPTWASVRTGLFGLSESLVPLTNATWDREALHVGVEKSRVKDAPRVDPEAEISPDEQERLYSYYGMSAGGAMGEGAAGAMGGGRHVGGGTARNDVDADRVDGYDAGTMSGTGYGAGAGAAGAGLAGAGVGHSGRHGSGSPSQYGDGPAGPRFDRGQSREADEPRAVQTDAGYGEVADEPGGADVRGSGRTAGDGRGSGDFASTGTALEQDNPVAEEAEEGTGSGYGTSEVEDISGTFTDGRTAEMREAGATPAGDARSSGMPGMAGGVAGGGAGGTGMQGTGGGTPRLRRYVVAQETIIIPVDDDAAGGSNASDSSTGMRMDDQDPGDPGLR